MKGKLPLLIFWGSLLVLGSLHAQSIDSLMNMYDSKMPQEKIYVHFDNTLYTPGQTVWFKAYLVKDILPSGLSRNLYIDWFDEKGKIVTRSVAPIINATAAGNFLVPKNYIGNQLQVMAYTKWMLNFDSSFLFHQTLRVAQQATIVKDQSAVSSRVPVANEQVIIPVASLQFFPEGGDMIENIAGYIAFKALSNEGLPVQVSGSIINKSKQVVAQFNTEHDGMGKIRFKPMPDETYTAEWKDSAGNLRSTALPAVKHSGIVLTIVNESVIRPFTIERSSIAEDRFKKLTLTGTMNQQVVYNAVINLIDKTIVSNSIPASDYPSGVLRLTVFDNNREPVAERILFVNNEEYLLNADILADTLNFEKRGKNVYEIDLEDTIPASLSLSVTEGESSKESSQNIISQLLLSSEIRGNIENPAYYFNSPEDSVAHQLDLIMMTNGWRRFAWSDVLSQKTPKLLYEKDSGYMAIAGKIDKLSERKLKKTDLVNLILMTKDSSRHFIFTPLQPDGSFKEDNLILYDTTTVFYRLNKVSIPVRSNVAFSNRLLPFDPLKKNTALIKYLADTTGMARLKAIAAEQRRLDSLMKLTTLKEVIVRTKVKSRIEVLDERYASGVFQGTMGNVQILNLVDDPYATHAHSVFSYSSTRVPPQRQAGFLRIPTTYFLDEMVVDRETLLGIPVYEVAYIKVYNSFVGASGNGPAYAVYTKKGEDAKNLFTDMHYSVLPGYTPVKEFYSPNYAETQKNIDADTRRTLYWKPNIDTDGTNKKIRVSFYNNDISHSFRFTLEGLAQDGRFIHFTKLFK